MEAIDQATKAAFEKGINFVEHKGVEKFIVRVKNKHLRTFKRDKKVTSVYTFLDENQNYQLMFFYHGVASMKAIQYPIGKSITPESTNILCWLFAEYCINLLTKLKIQHPHTKMGIAEYCNRQIAGYKEFLTKQKQ